MAKFTRIPNCIACLESDDPETLRPTFTIATTTDPTTGEPLCSVCHEIADDHAR